MTANTVEVVNVSDSGYIKLHRKFTEWEWYKCKNTKLVFIHLLMTANYKQSRFMGHDIPPGSVVTGRIALSDAVGISQQQLRTSLDKLKSTGEITIKTTNRFSIVYIVKWSEYQIDQPAEQPTGNQLVTNNQPTGNQQVTTSKEGKKVRKQEGKNNKPLAVRPDNVSPQVWNDFLTIRKAKRSPLTVTALNGIISQSIKAGISIEKALVVCCERGWMSFKAEWMNNIKGNDSSLSDEDRFNKSGAGQWLAQEKANGRA